MYLRSRQELEGNRIPFFRQPVPIDQIQFHGIVAMLQCNPHAIAGSSQYLSVSQRLIVFDDHYTSVRKPLCPTAVRRAGPAANLLAAIRGGSFSPATTRRRARRSAAAFPAGPHPAEPTDRMGTREIPAWPYLFLPATEFILIGAESRIFLALFFGEINLRARRPSLRVPCGGGWTEPGRCYRPLPGSRSATPESLWPLPCAPGEL